MAALPLLPGYQISNPKKEKYPRIQTLEWKKGVPISHQKSELPFQTQGSTEEFELESLTRKELFLQFGDKKHAKTQKFLPKWVIYDKKTLMFNGYFTDCLEKGDSVYAVRQIIMCYYLLDDTISIREPKTNNSGLVQGLILKRQKVPKINNSATSLSEKGESAHCFSGQEFWHWSDLNLDTVINIYGRNYVLCNCDQFTKEFLLSEGTELNPSVPIPMDPYETLRITRKETPQRISDLRPTSSRGQRNPSLKDTILKFNVMVEEILANNQCKATAAVLSYRLADDKIEIRKPTTQEDIEIKRFSPILLKWSKVPLNDVKRANIADIGEVDEFGPYFIQPQHLGPPVTLSIHGRKVLVTGCDEETSIILEKFFGVTGAPVNSSPKEETRDVSQGKVLTDIQMKPKIKHGVAAQDSKVLRFLAKLDSVKNEDQNRSFVISFYTIDSTFELYEKPSTGGYGGIVLSRTSVPKSLPPNESIVDQYYGLQDLFIGSRLRIWGVPYIITSADKYVHSYAENNTQQVPLKLLNTLRDHFKHQEEVAEDTL